MQMPTPKRFTTKKGNKMMDSGWLLFAVLVMFVVNLIMGVL
jgi:hypothetical protein